MQQKSAVRTPPSPGVAAIPKPLLAASVLAAALLAVSSALLYGLATRPSIEREWAGNRSRERRSLLCVGHYLRFWPVDLCGSAVARATVA
jgi:hypothetical protein